MQARNNVLIALLCIVIGQSQLNFSKPTGYSQTESYLEALAPTRQQAYEKVKKFLRAPDPITRTGVIEINDPRLFENLINHAIEVENKHPDYFVLYHASQKEGILLTLLRTYLLAQEQQWTRDDFFVLRSPEFFYSKSALSAADYIKQNIPLILNQYHSINNPSNCVYWQEDNCRQFDLDAPYRDYLISTSPAFIAGVDDTSDDQRWMSELDKTAWESSFYYFATNLSWSNVRRLYIFLVHDLKRTYPALFEDRVFEDAIINTTIRKYIAIKFNKIVDLLFPHAAQRLEAHEKIYAKAGMMFQILIPKNLIDDVAYLSWANGIIWQRTINGIKRGWDEGIGAYTQLSYILQTLQSNPDQLGRSIHLLQARIILKDKQYFYDISSPIKINLIHSLPISLFRVIEDSLKAIARVVVESNQAKQRGNQLNWFEQSNLQFDVERHTVAIKKLLTSTEVKQQIEGLNALYFLAHIGTEMSWAAEVAMQYSDSGNNELKAIGMEILQSIRARK